MEIIECEGCGQILTPASDDCRCPMPKDFLYGVEYTVFPSDEEE